MLQARLLYGALMIAAAVAILFVDAWLAPVYPILAVTMTAIAWIAAGELGRLLQSYPLPVMPRFCQIGAALIVLSNWAPHGLSRSQPLPPTMGAAMATFVAVSMLALLIAAHGYCDGSERVLAAACGHSFAFFYVGLLGSFVVQIRWLDARPAVGSFAIVLSVFVAKVCDIGAYFIGRGLGRHRMAPVLSPGKTWEGSIGGLLAGVALAFAALAMGKWITGKWLVPPVWIVPFGLTLGVIAQLGDLVESMIKRECRQKDASTSIPGFGGLLDVIDSVLFCGPPAYVILVAAHS